MAIQNNMVTIAGVDVFYSTGQNVITVAYFCNNSVGNVQVQIHAVPFGEAFGPVNRIYKDIVIGPGDTYIIDSEKLIFEDGDKLVGTSDIDGAISATVSSVGI